VNEPTHPTQAPGHPPEPRFDVEAEVLAADGGGDAHYDLCGTFAVIRDARPE
jgi:hypothetical protein